MQAPRSGGNRISIGNSVEIGVVSERPHSSGGVLMSLRYDWPRSEVLAIGTPRKESEY